MQKPKLDPMIIIKPSEEEEQKDKIHITEDKLENLQDILHQSYLNDQILMYDVINETKGLLTDVWEFIQDESTTTNKESKYEYEVDGKNGIIRFKDLLLDNNIIKEHKVSTSIYQKRRLKIIYNKQDYSQDEHHLSGKIDLVYVYNKQPNNNYLIKVGDIIHDKTNPDTFWIVYKVEEQVKQKTINIPNKNDFIQIYKLGVQRLNLSMLPKNIWQEYFPDKLHPQDIQEEEKHDVEIIEGDITLPPEEKEEVKEEKDKQFVEGEEDVDQIKDEDDFFKDMIEY